MKYVNTIHGRVPLWRWRLKWWLIGNREIWFRLVCMARGHRVVPDVNRLYCVRCHRVVPR